MVEPFVINRSVVNGYSEPTIVVTEWNDTDPLPLAWGYTATNRVLASILYEILVDSEMIVDSIWSGEPLAFDPRTVRHAKISLRDEFSIHSDVMIDGIEHMQGEIDMNDTETGWYDVDEVDGIESYVSTIQKLLMDPDRRLGKPDRVRMGLNWISNAYLADKSTPNLDGSVKHHMTINLAPVYKVVS